MNIFFFQFYPGDYLRDTMHLTRDHHGAYVLLMVAYYQRGKALPDDDLALAAITKSTAREWQKIRPVMSHFFDVRDGVWWHKRIERELDAMRQSLVGRREKASKGGKAMWEKRRAEQCLGDAPSSAQASAEAPLVEGSKFSNPSTPLLQYPITREPSIQDSESESSGGGSGGDEGGFVPDDGEVFGFAAAWPGELQPVPLEGPISPEFVKEWLKRMHGRREFPPRWKRALVAEWRAFKDPRNGTAKKTGGGVSESVQAVQRERELATLRRELAAAEEEADAESQSGSDEGAWRRANELRKRVRELEQTDGKQVTHE